MKTPPMPLYAWFVTIGALTVLLIGAFGNFNPAQSQPAPEALVVPEATAAVPLPIPPNLSPGMGEIIRMAQAHVDQSVILAYIQNSNEHYAPTGDELLLLSNLGLPQNVISELFKATPASPPAPSATPAPVPAVTSTAQLADIWLPPPDTGNDQSLLADNNYAPAFVPALSDSPTLSPQLPPLCYPATPPPPLVYYLASSARAFAFPRGGHYFGGSRALAGGHFLGQRQGAVNVFQRIEYRGGIH